MIKNCIEEAGRIAGIGLVLYDRSGEKIAGNMDFAPSKEEICSFIEEGIDEKETDGRILKLIRDNDTSFVLCSYKTEDRNTYYQDLLLDNMLPVDIYNKARKLHLDASQKRCVFVIEPVGEKDDSLLEMVRELFYTEAGDHVTAVDENHVVVIRAVAEGDDEEDLEETAKMLVDMAGSEAVSDVRVAYGTVADDIKGVSLSYKEAKLALDVAGIFYPFRKTIEYTHLGVGRLIYQLPIDLCRLFVKEIFGDDIPEEIDEEVLTTVNRFFENNLNVSETSRQLFIHRNTLMYRIEKLQKATGLDVRVFDDALTLKIALMVVNYMKYIEKK